MEWWMALLLIFGGLLAVMGTGMPVAFCFLVINLIGVFIWWGGEAGLPQLMLSLYSAIGTWNLLPIPMFVLMGEVLFYSGMGTVMIDTVDMWFGRLPGRLSLVAVGAGTIASTMSGSSIATTSMLGTLLQPEMEKHGYKKSMSIGPIIGSGGLAMIIPPSALAVVLGAVAEISIGQLLMAGVIPGLLIAALYASYILIRCWLQPSIAPSYAPNKSIPLPEKVMATLKYMLPMALIIFLVIGVIFIGFATPTEAGAMGALGCLILAAFKRRSYWEITKKSIIGTVQLTVMTLIILSSAIAFSQILAFSGASQGLVEVTTGLALPPLLVVIAMQIVLLFLGMFMSSTAMIMIAVPIMMPVVRALGLNDLWFGLVLLLIMETALLTPPFGMLLFVMKSIASSDTTMGDIIKASLPFVGCNLAALALIIAFPGIAIWLPGLMR